jgi:hypothetical protein
LDDPDFFLVELGLQALLLRFPKATVTPVVADFIHPMLIRVKLARWA